MAFLNSRPALPVVAQLAVAFAVLVTKWNLRRRAPSKLHHPDAQLTMIAEARPLLSQARAFDHTTLPFWLP
ncbi:MAG: hypothetical protein GJ676_03295 [Rhodobacteraceae bacterium]|nr:hypothetical protein [Paracoccaceae bacterium]